MTGIEASWVGHKRNPFHGNPYVWKQLGIDVKEGRNIRKDKDGMENIDDYFTDSDGEDSEITLSDIDSVKGKAKLIRSLREMSSFSSAPSTGVSAGIASTTLLHPTPLPPDVDDTMFDKENRQRTSDTLQKDTIIYPTLAQAGINVLGNNISGSLTKTDNSHNTSALLSFQTKKKLRFSEAERKSNAGVDFINCGSESQPSKNDEVIPPDIEGQKLIDNDLSPSKQLQAKSVSSPIQAHSSSSRIVNINQISDCDSLQSKEPYKKNVYDNNRANRDSQLSRIQMFEDIDDSDIDSNTISFKNSTIVPSSYDHNETFSEDEINILIDDSDNSLIIPAGGKDSKKLPNKQQAIKIKDGLEDEKKTSNKVVEKLPKRRKQITPKQKWLPQRIPTPKTTRRSPSPRKLIIDDGICEDVSDVSSQDLDVTEDYDTVLLTTVTNQSTLSRLPQSQNKNNSCTGQVERVSEDLDRDGSLSAEGTPDSEQLKSHDYNYLTPKTKSRVAKNKQNSASVFVNSRKPGTKKKKGTANKSCSDNESLQKNNNKIAEPKSNDELNNSQTVGYRTRTRSQSIELRTSIKTTGDINTGKHELSVRNDVVNSSKKTNKRSSSEEERAIIDSKKRVNSSKKTNKRSSSEEEHAIIDSKKRVNSSKKTNKRSSSEEERAIIDSKRRRRKQSVELLPEEKSFAGNDAGFVGDIGADSPQEVIASPGSEKANKKKTHGSHKSIKSSRRTKSTLKLVNNKIRKSFNNHGRRSVSFDQHTNVDENYEEDNEENLTQEIMQSRPLKAVQEPVSSKKTPLSRFFERASTKRQTSSRKKGRRRPEIIDTPVNQEDTSTDKSSYVRYSTSSPVHIFEVTTSDTPKLQKGRTKEKLIYPGTPPVGVRRSKRVRVRPLQHYKGERLDYEAVNLGQGILGIIPPINSISSVPKKLNKLKSAGNRKRKIDQDYRRLSIHCALPADTKFDEYNGDIECIDPTDGKPVAIECLKNKEEYFYVGPSGKAESKDDKFIITKPIRQKSFSMGEIILRPLAEKGLQKAMDLAVAFFVTKGKVAVTIHETTSIVQQGDMFFVPQDNLYNIKNLRRSNACLSFFQLMKDD